MKSHLKSFLLVLAFSFAMALSGSAQVFDEKFEHWPLDLKINGQIVVAGELKDVAVLGRLIRASGRQKKTAVVLASPTDAMKTSFTELFAKSEELEFVDVPETTKEIETLLGEHNVVVWQAEDRLNDDLASEIHQANDAFKEFLGDGKTLVALGSVAEIVAQAYYESDDANPPVIDGLNLLPDCVLETDFDGSDDQDRLLTILAAKEHGVGIGLDKNTALVLSGRKMRVAGPGKATFVLKGNEREPARVRSIGTASRRSRDPKDFLLDLTQWRRDAIDRLLPQFPAEKPRKPFVKNGTLIIVGGGGSPRGLMDQFIELAGGFEKAKLVYVPCSEQDDVGKKHSIVSAWKRAGVKNATFIHTKDRDQANSDDDFLEPLKDATGIYFGGGRQWNFSDSYYGTQAHRLMKEVLGRGGVIAGSSAGASIQGRYLARATPIGNTRIMAFGYERGGLGFLDGVAIDQHFSQRRRQKDMTRLVTRYPQLLGIGIDESTAIVVQKSIAKVIGRGKVHFYDRNQPVAPVVSGKPTEPDYIALPAGAEYDLAKRQVLQDATKKSTPEYPNNVVPQTAPPYFYVRYEGSEKPGELIYGVTCTVWVPPGVKTLRGVIVHQHGCGHGAGLTGLTGTFDLHWQALARKHRCALLSPSYEQPKEQSCSLWADPREGSESSFIKALSDLGKKTGHREMATVPWALWGHSGGGHWAGGIAFLHPQRVAALWLNSGPLAVEPNPDRPEDKPFDLTPAALKIPIMCNQGALEGITKTDGRFASVWPRFQFLFHSIRSRGGLIGHAVDPLTEHPCGNQRYLAIPWFDTCLEARLPKPNPQEQSGTALRPMPQESAWLAPLLGGEAVPASQYDGETENSVWLPNEAIAKAWMSYMKDTSVPDDTAPPAPRNLEVVDNKLTWTAEADLESGLAYFIIQRDGKFLAKVPESDENTQGRPLFQSLYNGDTPRQPLPEMTFTDTSAQRGVTHSYRVIAVNTVGLESE